MMLSLRMASSSVGAAGTINSVIPPKAAEISSLSELGDLLSDSLEFI